MVELTLGPLERVTRAMESKSKQVEWVPVADGNADAIFVFDVRNAISDPKLKDPILIHSAKAADYHCSPSRGRFSVLTP